MLLVPPRGETFQPCPLKQNLSTSYLEYGWYTWNWFDQAGSSRCEKLLCPAVKCMLAGKTLEEGSFSHWIRHLIFTKRIFNKKKKTYLFEKSEKSVFSSFRSSCVIFTKICCFSAKSRVKYLKRAKQEGKATEVLSLFFVSCEEKAYYHVVLVGQLGFCMPFVLRFSHRVQVRSSFQSFRRAPRPFHMEILFSGIKKLLLSEI